MNRREKLALSTSTLIAILLTSIAASATGVSVLDASHAELDSAKEPYLDGVKYMNSKHYKEAAERFRQSYDIVASPNSRLMLGRALAKLNQPLEAYREFEATVAQATELAGKQAKYQKTAEAARKELDDIKVELAFITVIPGTEVSIGGRKLADGDWGKQLPVTPGKVTVEITSTDGRVRKKRLRMEPGISRVLSADLTSATAAAAADTKEESDKPEEQQGGAAAPVSSSGGGLNRKTVGFVAGGIGIAGIAAFVGTTIAANSVYGDLKANCNKGGSTYCSRNAVDNAEGKGRYEGFGLASLAVGIVGVGVGAYLILSDRSAGPASTQTSTSLQLGPGSVALQRTF